MAISAEDVKKLREQTGAGMLDSKNALEKAKGDVDKAKAILNEAGFAAATKRADRETAEGLVQSYIHHNQRVGALVEVNCETDFVARTDDFKELVAAIALQIGGTQPKYVSIDDLPADSDEDPKEVVLLEQQYLRDESKTVADLVRETISRTGENIRIKRFSRFELGAK
ncbi:MAG: translation elongation factor Ts [Chloroflexi bacterium]|nr:translation elongation factor Ts [Chloroflexota bacterium]MCH7953273.1 translation elongation factor Ts [Chloroflexota bacterium]MCI0783928.1 translation elongation factor Ts [Chloroflexota bacterium]MCI0815360.1 translation elongation factor Ts [Chloroflexota bacterium]MCI0818001.1 translation elongation factor Ts [Chloroflexota bacterium]